jgi:hypothetical protein
MSVEKPINVQDIMQEIEQQIWAKKDDLDANWLPQLDPELRAHLVRLRELASSLQVQPIVQHSSLPLFGRLITWWRTQIHQLVLFYINDLVRQQVHFEQAVTRTLIYLAGRLASENEELRAEVEDLRQELTRIRHIIDDQGE